MTQGAQRYDGGEHKGMMEGAQRYDAGSTKV